MSNINEILTTEIIDEAYKKLRNAPRDTIRDRLVRVAAECLQQYDDLQVALGGGDEDRGIPDISSKSAQFATVTGQVTSFISLLQAAMRIIVQTTQIIDQAAVTQGMIVPPFGVNISTPLDPADYAAMLAEAAAAIQGTAVALQAMGGE